MKHAIGTFPVPALPSLPIRILLLSSALILIARLPLTLAQSSGGRPTTRVLAADSLAAPWFNASWGGAFDLTNTEQVWAGATAIKATLAEGGGLRLRSGDWNHPVGQDLSPYDTLSLRLRLDSPGPLRVGLSGDDPAVSFPAVALDSRPGSGSGWRCPWPSWAGPAPRPTMSGLSTPAPRASPFGWTSGP